MLYARTQSARADVLLAMSTCPHRRVDDRKDAERQAYVQRRAERETRSERGHNPFPQNVVRSVHRGRDADEVYSVAPTVLADFTGMGVFYSTAPLDGLLDKLVSSLKGMKDTPLVTLKHKTAKVGTSHALGRIDASFRDCRVTTSTERESCLAKLNLLLCFILSTAAIVRDAGEVLKSLAYLFGSPFAYSIPGTW